MYFFSVTKQSDERHADDIRYIDGLKKGYDRVTHQFFYQEIVGILHRIRLEVFKGHIDIDEMVGELYTYLSRDGWAKLDGFDGKNGCRLRSWMIPVAWRFFLSIKDELLCREHDDSEDRGRDSANDDDFRIQVAIDVRAVLAKMPNHRYAEILRLLLIEGYSPKEVAGILGMKVDNVYNLKHRAISQFMKLWGK